MDENGYLGIISEALKNGKSIEQIIDNLPHHMLTEEVVLYAIENIYTLSKNTPDIIKDNPEFLCAYLKNEYYEGNDIILVLAYGNQSKFDDKLINLLVRRLNTSLLKRAYIENMKIKNKKLLYKYASKGPDLFTTLFFTDPSILDKETITFLANHCCVNLDEPLPEIISNNKEYIKLLLELTGSSHIIEKCSPDILDDEILYMAIEDGYFLTEDSPSYLSSNRKLANILLEIGTLSQWNRSFYLIEDGILTRESMFKAIDKGYYGGGHQLPKLFFSDYELLYRMIEKNGSTEYVAGYVDKCDEKILDIKLMELALDKGYIYTNFTRKFVKNNYHLLKYALEHLSENKPQDAVDNFVNNCSPNILDDELINLAIEKGYQLSFQTPEVILNNRKYAMSIIKKGDISGLICIPLNVLTIEDISWIIKHYPNYLASYFLRHDNFEYVELLFKKEYDHIICENKDQEKISRIKDELGYTITTIYFDHFIFSDELIKKLGIKQVCRLFKYTILAGQKINLDKILEHNNIDMLVIAYSSIMRKDINTLDVLSFTTFIDFYLKYENIINILIKMHKIDEYRPNLLRLIDNNYELEITSLKGLDNINRMIFEENRRFLLERENSNSFQRIIYELPIKKLIKERICMLITDHTLGDMNIFLTEIMNSYKAKQMYLNVKEPNIRRLLHHYVNLLDFLEFVINNDDLFELKKILEILNEYSINNPDKISVLIDNFKYIEKITKFIYGYEANSTLTHLDKLNNGSTMKIYKNKFTSNNIVAGEALTGRSVDYIELSDEAYFFIHKMDFCGKRGKISDFKHPRLIGKTYICLSAISSIYKLEKGLYSVNTADDVILIFDNIDPKSLICMSNGDIYSDSANNSLVISSNKNNFDSLKSTIENTSYYNEYVFYREDSNGNHVYPSAVLVLEDKPTQYEIDAACYLNIPLVKMNYVNSNTIENKITDENDLFNDYTYSKDLDMLGTVLDEVLEYVSSDKYRKIL